MKGRAPNTPRAESRKPRAGQVSTHRVERGRHRRRQREKQAHIDVQEEARGAAAAKAAEQTLSIKSDYTPT